MVILNPTNDAKPLGARIIAVGDAYDAMTTHRPYHEPVSPEDAVAELTKNAGTQFDAAVVDAFVRVLAQQAAPANTPRHRRRI